MEEAVFVFQTARKPAYDLQAHHVPVLTPAPDDVTPLCHNTAFFLHIWKPFPGKGVTSPLLTVVLAPLLMELLMRMPFLILPLNKGHAIALQHLNNVRVSFFFSSLIVW